MLRLAGRLIGVRLRCNHQFVAVPFCFLLGRILAGFRQPFQQIRYLSLVATPAESEHQMVQRSLIVGSALEDRAAFLGRGCVNCHGGPGIKWAKFSEGLNPGPPDLKDVVGALSAPELFWVVKNGINMTGMPSFGATGVPDQEIWSIAAFLKRLPGVSDSDFKTWTAASGG